MANQSNFPWEILKAECLRLVCQQLQPGISNALGGRKDEMVTFLKDVNQRGLPTAVETVEEQYASRKNHQTLLPFKPQHVHTEDDAENEEKGRQTEDEDEELDALDSQQPYNTRYKGVKRVKVGMEKPDNSNSTPKRPRGRPRKNPQGSGAGSAVVGKSSRANPTGSTSSTPRKKTSILPTSTPRQGVKRPEGKPKELFDGVLMVRRKQSPRNALFSLDTSATNIPNSPNWSTAIGANMNGGVDTGLNPVGSSLNGVAETSYLIQSEVGSKSNLGEWNKEIGELSTIFSLNQTSVFAQGSAAEVDEDIDADGDPDI